MSKIRPGVCGLCGTAVVQSVTMDLADALEHGHYYENELGADKKVHPVLKKVRCLRHRDPSINNPYLMPELTFSK